MIRRFFIGLFVFLSICSIFACQKSREITETFDNSGDKKIDTWRIYREGVLVRVEKDTDNDGKVDLWEFYADMRIVRRDIDRNKDGKADHQIFIIAGRQLFDDDYDGVFERTVMQ